jgi:next-to-BRCA1 protein 1
VGDTSVPDGTAVQPGSRFTKGWLVFNNGKQAWAPGMELVHVSGASFGAAHVALPALGPCRTATLLVAMKAPKKAGTHAGVWRFEDQDGHRFGDKLTVVIKVAKTPPAGTPTPTVLPTATPSTRRPTPVPTATPTGL